MGNILVVDDERSIRVTVKAFLEMDGHCVETAEEAESAVAILQSEPIDVVLTDIILPRVSGVDLLRRIHERSPQVQVIMMTGEPTLETASESLRLGAVDYLQKPVGKNEILKAVRNALHVKHLSDEKLRLEEENLKYLNALEELAEKRTHALAASEAALRHRAEELAMLNRLARKVNESITVEDTVRCGLREIVQAVGPDLALFFLRTGEDLVLKGMFPERSDTVWEPVAAHKVGTCLCGLTVKEDNAIYASDIRTDPRCNMEECLKAGFRSFAGLPLRNGLEIMGVLGIASLQPKNFHEQASFLEALANEMSIGLNKSLLYEQVQQHAMELKASLSRIEEGEAERLMLLQHLQRVQKMEAIGTLASGIAHDFNNILAAMIGYTELALLSTSDESKSRKSLDMVLTAGERAKDLVKQILAFSRQSEEERKPIQVAHTVKEVLKFIRASLPATIEIRQNLGTNIDNILGDPVQIHQVLMNLCTNAHHAMREKGGVLDVEVNSVNLGPEYAAVHPDLNPGPHVKVTLRDNGHGMNEPTMAKIFDPYFTTKEKGVGTGLGLSVVHGIVQKHGGAITVASEPGKGSVFELYFPAIENEAVAETRVQQTPPTGHERILLVDDEQVLADMGRQMLEYLGYRVETRTSSVDALALFSAYPERFDLVITDMTMPNMTGDKLAVELMRIRADIPIVVCTGYSERIMAERAKAIGIRAFVMKPILMAKMAQAIREALGHQRDTVIAAVPGS
jgi:signal transduction histidine kinase/FixJ family two-component response regulator